MLTDSALPTAASAAHSGIPGAKLMGVSVLCAVLFFLSLIPLEAIPEIPVDIDQKAFFIPVMLAALLPVGRATWSVAFGAALGEGMRDLVEGYEPDDPIGFAGYVLAFTLAGYIIGNRPLHRGRLVAASIAAGGLQAAFEASSFLILAEESKTVALLSGLGNTFTHGIIGGALPLVLIVPALHGRIERYMGFAPKPADGRLAAVPPLPAPSAQGLEPADGAAIAVRELRMRYPGNARPALDGIDFSLMRGRVLGITGPVGAGKTTLCMLLAGFAPRVTGGDSNGHVAVLGRDPRPPPEPGVQRRVALVFEDYAAQLTQINVIEEVMAPLLNRGRTRAQAGAEARRLLARVGLEGTRFQHKRSWELSGGQQLRLAVAAVLATEPEVLILDCVTRQLDAAGRDDLARILDERAGRTTLVLVEDDSNLLLERADEVLILAQGRRRAFGPAREVLGDLEMLRSATVEPPLPVRLAHALQLERTPQTPQELVRMLGPVERQSAPRAAAAGSAPPLIEVESAGFAYVAADPTGGSRRVPALHEVSLRIARGEVHALLGADGAGKSTLARLLAGVSKPDHGEVRIDGRSTRGRRVAEIAEQVGLTYQNPDEQISERSVAGEIAFPLKRRHQAGEQRERLIESRLCAIAELLEFDEATLAADPSLLPRGRRKLVAIAGALALEPRLLVLDEPTVGLDAALRARLLRLLSKLREQGRAVVLIDHDVDFVSRIAERVTVLAEGRVVLHGALHELFTHPQLPDWRLLAPRAAQWGAALGVSALNFDELREALHAARSTVAGA